MRHGVAQGGTRGGARNVARTAGPHAAPPLHLQRPTGADAFRDDASEASGTVSYGGSRRGSAASDASSVASARHAAALVESGGSLVQPSSVAPAYSDMVSVGSRQGSGGRRGSIDSHRSADVGRAFTHPALAESSADRAKYKDFYKQVRAQERSQPASAFEFAMGGFEALPLCVHWRLCLELAEMSKRENRIGEARLLYEAAVSLRPDEPQVWLDFSKMEEDVGESERCNAILQEGLRNCEGNEVLLTRAVKQAERQGRIQQARELLSRLQSVDMPPEKAWRTVLEGAQMEARAGNQKIARKVFKYLMKHVPWCVRVVAVRGGCRRHACSLVTRTVTPRRRYGPIYYEAFRFEERCQDDGRALRVIRRGIREIARYGPLWFGAFRLYEKLETEAFVRECTERRLAGLPMLPVDGTALSKWLSNTRASVADAITCISQELVWKVRAVACGCSLATQLVSPACVWAPLGCAPCSPRGAGLL